MLINRRIKALVAVQRRIVWPHGFDKEPLQKGKGKKTWARLLVWLKATNGVWMRDKDEKTLLYNTLESLDEHRVGWTWAIWQMSTGLANRKTWDQTSHVTSTYLSAHLFMSVFLCPLINLPAALPCLYTCLSVSAFIYLFFSPQFRYLLRSTSRAHRDKWLLSFFFFHLSIIAIQSVV